MNIEYNLVDDSDPNNLIYQVTIRGETKTVKFRKHPEDGSYAGYPDLVYVSISPPLEHHYSNMVRKTHLRLNSKRELLDLYSVMNKDAFIVSWKDSVQGDLFKHNESFDQYRPYAIGKVNIPSDL